MLGQLLALKSSGTEYIEISDMVSQIVVHGVRVEAKVEEKGLCLSKLEIVDNKLEKYEEHVLNLNNLLAHRREDLAHTNLELKQLTLKMVSVAQAERKALFDELDFKAEIKLNHEREIERLEAQTTIGVNYQVRKSGVFKVIPPDQNQYVDFLCKVVSWCPTGPPSVPFDEVEDKYEEMPLSLTSAAQTTASGSGLESCCANQESTFVIVAKDAQGQARDRGGDTFLVESADGELKSSVVDNSNGTYHVSYVAPENKEGRLSVSVMLRGRPIRGSPFGISVSSSCEGVFHRMWGSHGSGQGQLNHSAGVAVAGQEVYVADTSNHRLQVFSTTGTYQRPTA